jgi:hypothetical protein
MLGHLGHVHPHAAGDINAARHFGEAGLDLLSQLLAFNGALQQRLQHREQGLRFVESEGLHGDRLWLIGYDERGTSRQLSAQLSFLALILSLGCWYFRLVAES